MRILHENFRSDAHRTDEYGSASVLGFRTDSIILKKFSGA